MSKHNPYSATGDHVREPPANFWQAIPYVGPGFILSASIVGSGELIATTTLGANVGYVALWAILLGCLVKVAIQLEFGRYAILEGATAVEGMSRVPGPRGKRINWLICLWLGVWPLKLLQMGGIVGAVAQVLSIAWPRGDSWPVIAPLAWCWILAIGVALLVSLEGYRAIERTCIVLLALFTLLTLVSVGVLQWTPYAIEWSQLASGFQFALPKESALLFLVVGSFGLTGVGGDEVMQYTYWLHEKGYAAYTGPRDDSAEWRVRARGWIRVMQLDALLSMVAYTIVTAAFYVLGAAVLHARGEVPEGKNLVATLSTMYTETLGPWSAWVFLAGAFIVLFSTLYSALAAWARVFADALAHIVGFSFREARPRRIATFWLTWGFAIVWAALCHLNLNQVTMVMWGGVATSIILLLVVVAAVWFRWFGTRREMAPGLLFDGALVVSCLSIAAFAVYLVVGTVREFVGS
jgi:manganese transport protein